MKKEQFQLLCKDGSRRSVNEYRTCNWGRVPSPAVVTSTATQLSVRLLYQKFLQKVVQEFRKNRTDTNYPNDKFNHDQGNYENSSYNPNENGYNMGRNGEPVYPYEYNTDSLERSYDREYMPRVRPIEVFDLFESAPRYGIQHNLLFSVRSPHFSFDGYICTQLSIRF